METDQEVGAKSSSPETFFEEECPSHPCPITEERVSTLHDSPKSSSMDTDRDMYHILPTHEGTTDDCAQEDVEHKSSSDDDAQDDRSTNSQSH